MTRSGEARFASFYETYHRHVAAYCRAEAHQVDDLSAEVFLTAWRKIDDAPDGNEGNLSPGDDDCFFRAFIVGPSITMMAADSPIDVTGLPTELNLEGKWGDEATGLEITGNDYAIAIDGEVVDRGTYELQISPYLLVLESESTDATCATATYGLSIEGGEVLSLENNRIGEDECTARSGIGMRPLELGGTFEIPDAEISGSNDG